jgi:AraC-like DNA-binding protein
MGQLGVRSKPTEVEWRMTGSLAEVTRGQESTRMVRFILEGTSAGSASSARLLHQAGLPDWLLDCGDAMISPHFAFRLWELAEREFRVAHLPLEMASRHRLGELDLFDYLFSTAATLREGFAVTMRYLHLLTTNARLEVEAETGDETTYSYRFHDAQGRGPELGMQLAIKIFCVRAQAGTARPVTPVRLAFAQPAPRLYRGFAEAFGAQNVDFGTPVTSMTFHARDLDSPMRAADPALARILASYAATLPPPPSASWLSDYFRKLLMQALADDDRPSLDAIARRLSVSRRTLQRQLAEQGTTWRAELDGARHQRAMMHREASTAEVAQFLGYSSGRSVRRARRRWESSEDRLAQGS